MNSVYLPTVWFVIGSVVLIGTYDVFIFSRKGLKGTISHLIYSQSFKYPIIPFAFGLLMGHFFT